MKLLFDYFPILCFFIAYKLWGVYIATAITMGACALQNIIYWLIHRKFEKMHVITFFSVLILGSFTLIFHNAIFIQWKPSIIYWLFSVVLFYGQYFSHKNLIARMLDEKIFLPHKIWNHLNMAWIVFFIFLGCLNIYVVYHYSMDTWVNFKLFGTLGLTLVFTIGQAIYMSRHVIENSSTAGREEI